MKQFLWVTVISIVTLLGLASVNANANHDHIMWDPQGLPVDEYRGPWFATIDLEATEWAWQRETYLTRKGPTALRFEVREGDCFTAKPHNPESEWDDCTRDRERSEIREKWYAPLNRDVWYAFSMYIPNDYEYAYPKQIFWQLHGGDWGPNVYFQLNRDTFLVDILTEEHTTTYQYKIGELPKGEWIDFSVNAVFSNKNDGKLMVWIDFPNRQYVQAQKPQLVLEHYGPTMDDTTYNIGKGPYAKMGIYRSHLFRWKEDRPFPTQVLYFDEYRRGLSYPDVNPDNHQGD